MEAYIDDKYSSCFKLQGYEDWLRHKADREVNCRTNLIVHNGQLQEVKAMNVEVSEEFFDFYLILIDRPKWEEVILKCNERQYNFNLQISARKFKAC